MDTHCDPRELAKKLVERSRCRKGQVSAVLADNRGIFQWGWNHEKNGKGVHAEEHAIGRANPKRLRGATIFIAGKRAEKFILARPCEKKKLHSQSFFRTSCMGRIRQCGIGRVEYTTPSGWAVEKL